MPESHQISRLRRWHRQLSITNLVALAIGFLALAWFFPLWSTFLLFPLLAVGVWLYERSKDDHAELITFPPGEQDFAFAVRLHVVQDGVITGLDWGRMWVQDNALFFTGNRCSFVVASEDLAIRRWKAKWFEPEAPDNAKSVSFWIRHPSRELRILMTFVERPVKEHLREFGRQIGSIRPSQAEVRWKTVYPPLKRGWGIPTVRLDLWMCLYGELFFVMAWAASVTRVAESLLPTAALMALLGWRVYREFARLRILRRVR